jgi:class 3 adenylate cyclase
MVTTMTDTSNRQKGEESQRRYLAILFSDLSDSSRLAGTMEAEDFSDLLQKLRRAYEDIVPKHGGTIVQIQGDGLLASFGYPEAHEDDGRRATEAALDLHDVVRSLRFDPSRPNLRIAISIQDTRSLASSV